MIQPPPGMSAFQFITLASLRAAQLQRGCLPRVDGDGTHKATVIAQVEVAERRVTQRSSVVAPAGEPGDATHERPPLELQTVAPGAEPPGLGRPADVVDADAREREGPTEDRG